MRRGYLTDFHGSAGTALVTTDSDKTDDEEGGGDGGGGGAYLWTDSRYHNEAALRLDSNHWQLMKQGQPKVPTITKFLADMAVKHYETHGRALRVGLDAYVHSAAFAKELNEAFLEAAKDVVASTSKSELPAVGSYGMENVADHFPPVIALIDTLDGKPNLVDSIWDGRPAIPKNPFRVHVRSSHFFCP